MLAAWRNQNPQVVSTLLKAGADGKVKDYDGKTAFDHAQSNTKFRGTDALEKLEEAAK
jgi:ankyrin repeat protein